MIEKYIKDALSKIAKVIHSFTYAFYSSALFLFALFAISLTLNGEKVFGFSSAFERFLEFAYYEQHMFMASAVFLILFVVNIINTGNTRFETLKAMPHNDAKCKPISSQLQSKENRVSAHS